MSRYGVDDILGPETGSFVGYATDASVRANAASGGIVSAITRFLLSTGAVDAVLASKVEIRDGEVTPRTVIARDVADLEQCRNSIYLDFSIGAHGIYQRLVHELTTTENRLCVVGLYCHLKSLIGVMERRGIARSRVIMIGLFCSHAPQRTLLKQVLDRQGAKMDQAIAYHTKTGDGLRDGRLHGRSTLVYRDGSTLDFPFIEFTAFKNAWFYTPKKCLWCPDQFSEIADISCGDAWYKEIRRHRLKQTTVVTRTDEARRLILLMVRERKLELRSVDPCSIVSSQRRVAGVEKAALAARVKLAPWFGIKLPGHQGSIRLRDIAHSLLMLWAVKISGRARVMKVIMKLPTPLVLGFTLLIKVVEHTLLSNFPKGKGVGPVISGYEPTPELAVERKERSSR